MASHTTLFILYEQVQARLNEAPKSRTTPTKGEIMRALVQVINLRLKGEYVATVLADGERIPDGLMKAVFENVPVTQYKNKSRAIMPVVPISLPHNMGVWEVMAQEDLDCQFIPYPSGQRWMMKREKLISKVIGQFGYEVNAPEILFDTDLTTLDTPIHTVMLRLIVGDPTRMGDFDILPIPSDMEAVVVDDTFKLFAQRPAVGDSTVDLMADQRDKK
jgi:hypothetical protein